MATQYATGAAYYPSTSTATPAHGSQQAYSGSQYSYGQYNYYSSQTQASAAAGPPDGHENWYMDPHPANRMLLSIRSGVPIDTEWALERLLGLTVQWSDRFHLKIFPGMADALYELAEWTLGEGQHVPSYLALPPEPAYKRRTSLSALLVLRNASMEDTNMHYLEKHPRTFPLILSAMQILGSKGSDSEFLLYAIELFQSLAPRYHLKAGSPLLKALVRVTCSPDRTLVNASLNALKILFNSSYNMHLLDTDSPAFGSALRMLPLMQDPELQLSALDYLHAHLTPTSMTRAFFHHPQFPGVVRLLVSIILVSQGADSLDEPLPIPLPPSPTASAPADPKDLTEDEITRLLVVPEPQRAIYWMLKMFVADASASLTQVMFWNLYRDTFGPSHQSHLGASELIKNVNKAFPSALAMVMPNTQPTTYIIRGIRRRRKDEIARWGCRWSRAACPYAVGLRERNSPEELWQHLAVQHLGVTPVDEEGQNGIRSITEGKDEVDADTQNADAKPLPNGSSSSMPNGVHQEDDQAMDEGSSSPNLSPLNELSFASEHPDLIPDPSAPQECQWVNCHHTAPNLAALRRHVLTHIPPLVPELNKHSRLDRPAARSSMTVPLSANATSALLILHILFREAYPTPLPTNLGSDQRRTGFPFAVVVGNPREEGEDRDLEGEMRARSVFRGLLESISSIRVGPDAEGILTRWWGEMVMRITADVPAEI